MPGVQRVDRPHGPPSPSLWGDTHTHTTSRARPATPASGCRAANNTEAAEEAGAQAEEPPEQRRATDQEAAQDTQPDADAAASAAAPAEQAAPSAPEAAAAAPEATAAPAEAGELKPDLPGEQNDAGADQADQQQPEGEAPPGEPTNADEAPEAAPAQPEEQPQDKLLLYLDQLPAGMTSCRCGAVHCTAASLAGCSLGAPRQGQGCVCCLAGRAGALECAVRRSHGRMACTHICRTFYCMNVEGASGQPLAVADMAATLEHGLLPEGPSMRCLEQVRRPAWAPPAGAAMPGAMQQQPACLSSSHG